MKVIISILFVSVFSLAVGQESTAEVVAVEIKDQKPDAKISKSNELIPVVEEIKTDVDVIREQEKPELIGNSALPVIRTKPGESPGNRRSLSIYFSLLTGILLAVFAVASVIPPKSAKSEE